MEPFGQWKRRNDRWLLVLFLFPWNKQKRFQENKENPPKQRDFWSKFKKIFKIFQKKTWVEIELKVGVRTGWNK